MNFKSKNTKLLFIVLFVLYVIAVVLLKVIKPLSPHWDDWSLQYDWNPLIDPYTWKIQWSNYLANIVLMIPGGFFTRFFVKNNVVFGAICIVSCFLLEWLQPLFCSGVFDMSSVILSVVGFVLGGFALHCIRKHTSGKLS